MAAPRKNLEQQVSLARDEVKAATAAYDKIAHTWRAQTTEGEALRKAENAARKKLERLLERAGIDNPFPEDDSTFRSTAGPSSRDAHMGDSERKALIKGVVRRQRGLKFGADLGYYSKIDRAPQQAWRTMSANPSEWREFVLEQAAWDEGHAQPAVEYGKTMSPDAAIAQIREDLLDRRNVKQWESQCAQDVRELGGSVKEAHEVYVEEYLYRSERRLDHKGNPPPMRNRKVMSLTYKGVTYKVGDIVAHPGFGEGDIISFYRGVSPVSSPQNPSVIIGNDRRTFRGRMSEIAMVRNPSHANPARVEAVAKYEEFHRYPPTAIGDFPSSFEIPSEVLVGGRAKWVTYRSGKVDPSTLKKPRRPVNYIHEHDAGVQVYLPLDTEFDVDSDASEIDTVDVPREFREVPALVKLGESLGYAFLFGLEEVEAVGQDPLPELYCTPCGKCLFVIQDKREVLAMVWGGALGVFARGIDG